MLTVKDDLIRLWTIQPREVWDALEASPDGVLYVNPDHTGVWQDFRPSYEWLIEEMKKRVPVYSGHYPWWAWTTRPDMRWETWQATEGQNFSLIELELPMNQVCLTDFDLWNCILNGNFVPLSEADDEAWNAEWEGRFGEKYWKRDDVPVLDLQERDARKMASWIRIFNWDRPERDPVYWGDVILQATFETLDRRTVKRVSHHKGRRKAK